VIPSIRDSLKAGTSIEGLALVEAVWARMCTGTRENGTRIAPNDPVWNDLQAKASTARLDPDEWIRQTQYYGDLVDDRRFVDAFTRWLRLVWSDGIEEASRVYVDKRLSHA
jgi:mannitol 2-dehydrogenase